jgi:hypothetical protein
MNQDSGEYLELTWRTVAGEKTLDGGLVQFILT